MPNDYHDHWAGYGCENHETVVRADTLVQIESLGSTTTLKMPCQF